MEAWSSCSNKIANSWPSARHERTTEQHTSCPSQSPQPHYNHPAATTSNYPSNNHAQQPCTTTLLAAEPPSLESRCCGDLAFEIWNSLNKVAPQTKMEKPHPARRAPEIRFQARTNQHQNLDPGLAAESQLDSNFPADIKSESFCQNVNQIAQVSPLMGEWTEENQPRWGTGPTEPEASLPLVVLSLLLLLLLLLLFQLLMLLLLKNANATAAAAAAAAATATAAASVSFQCFCHCMRNCQCVPPYPFLGPISRQASAP